MFFKILESSFSPEIHFGYKTPVNRMFSNYEEIKLYGKLKSISKVRKKFLIHRKLGRNDSKDHNFTWAILEFFIFSAIARILLKLQDVYFFVQYNSSHDTE